MRGGGVGETGGRGGVGWGEVGGEVVSHRGLVPHFPQDLPFRVYTHKVGRH